MKITPKLYIFTGGVVLTGSVFLLTGGMMFDDEDPAFNPSHQCSYCHAVHNGDGPSLTIEQDVEILCLTCHGPGGISELKAAVHTNRDGSIYPPFSMSCIDCHDQHNELDNWQGGINLKNVGKSLDDTWLARIDTPNSGVREVVFESRGTEVGDPSLHSFADRDEDNNGYFDGVCETCHTETRYHRNDGSRVSHNDGKTCVSCHPHDAGFIPVAGACVDCHSVAQDNGDNVPPGGRRAVVGEFGLSSHHVMTDPIDSADCLACHDLSEHQQGYVRLLDVDDPGNMGAVITLTGNPAVDPLEAVKLEPFCLKCHDSDGAGGIAPFSDGIMPPVIDASLWSTGAHNAGGSAGPMTCYGDGETFGCHDTGHGSEKRKLQAPYDASQPPIPGDPLRQEEGMCYTCHDGNGPAKSNIQSMFAKAYHHKVSSIDQSDGSKVECANCHNPHYTNSTGILADPDSGGNEQWIGANVDFCLTCHDGAPPPDVSFPADAPGTGYDKSAFVGSTHANELGPKSCQHCHEEHGSVYAGLLRKQYITADRNHYSFGDGDYAACFACHNEDTLINRDNAFEDRHEKHVDGENAPCIVCHDAHAPFDAGEPGLINLAYPIMNGNYDISWYNTYFGSSSFQIYNNDNNGRCYIRCHGERHSPENYQRRNNPDVDCSPCH